MSAHVQAYVIKNNQKQKRRFHRAGMNISESRIKLIFAVTALLGVTVIGTLGMMHFEGWDTFDAIWMTIVSLSTTGYGDMVPQTRGGRIFMLIVLVGGLGVVTYSLGTIVNILMEGQFAKMRGDGMVGKAIDKLNNHIIVCGAGRVGSNVAEILKAEEAAYVVVDVNEERVNEMREQGHLVLQGDATRDDVLRSLGLTRASGIICALANDAFNVFVTLTARAVNPSLKIVSRAVQPETVAKLRHAGADKIVSTDKIGGHRMAMSILKPQAVELLDTLVAPNQLEIQIEELRVTENSSLVDQPLGAFFTRNEGDLIVVALIRDSEVKMHPGPDHIVQVDDVLVLIGSSDQMDGVADKIG